MRNDTVLSLLRSELKDAEQRHKDAVRRFRAAGGSLHQSAPISSSQPQREFDSMVRKAIAEEAEARNAHLKALVRFNMFLVDGVIPEDLRRPYLKEGDPES